MEVSLMKPEITVGTDAQLAARTIFSQGPTSQASFKKVQFTDRAWKAIQELVDADLITMLSYSSGVRCFMGKRKLRFQFAHFAKPHVPFPLLVENATR